MENTINIGIDLGTTNSAIAKFVKGEVTVFNNPLDYGRSSLPSVVYYKKDRIIVGNKARTYLQKDPKNVVGLFKRKMGTAESFKIASINEIKTPIELSSQVLKELKTFVTSSEPIESTVLTIPASFDLIQSNATKEAGYQAGFKQVVLLQEPIAASLAYANLKKSRELSDGQWLVYDLGGGTFDVALVRIKDGEMKVIDHEGDNFLGGADFDRLIVEKLVIPKILEEYSFSNLEDEMKSASGKYNAQYFTLLNAAEEAKVRLSGMSSAEIVVDRMEDENGTEVDLEVIITRSEFNALIKDAIDGTVDMIKKILTRNSLTSNEVQFNLLVGGSTYIPYVRERIEEMLGIPVNCEIDPTTAVAVGAAYYAATKPTEVDKSDDVQDKTQITIKGSYNKASKEQDELFAARVKGNIDGLSYKITREDGGFDSGLKQLEERINEDLPLVEDTFNFFTLTVYDSQNNVIETGFEPIGINSGFAISGQPLSEDICIEVDDINNPGSTKLERIFEKNTGLPAKKNMSFPLNKSLIKGNESDKIWIKVFEGPQTSLPEANKRVGTIKISGKQISRDVSKGSDIEITVAMSESRDLTISAYLNMTDQDFKDVFNPKVRDTNVKLLKEEISDMATKLEKEIGEASEKEDYETADALSKVKKEMDLVSQDIENLQEDDVTDARYQLEDKKRKIAQEIDLATKDNRVQLAIEQYNEAKLECEGFIDKGGNDHERKSLDDVVSSEEAFMSTNSPVKIQEKTDELLAIISRIQWRTPEFLLGVFNWAKSKQAQMNDETQAKSLFEAGSFAVESENWERLKEINFDLLELLPRGSKEEVTTKIGF